MAAKKKRGGRPPILQDRTTITISLPQELVDGIDAVAEEFSQSRSEFMRTFIRNHLDIEADMRRDLMEREIERRRAAEEARKKRRQRRIVKDPEAQSKRRKP